MLSGIIDLILNFEFDKKKKEKIFDAKMFLEERDLRQSKGSCVDNVDPAFSWRSARIYAFLFLSRVHSIGYTCWKHFALNVMVLWTGRKTYSIYIYI